jgi:putative addiction module CopG family antidote
MINSLPLDIQQRIEAQVASGVFASEADVLREALDVLERRQGGLKALQQMVAVAEEDVAAGRIGAFDREDIKREVRSRLTDQGMGG